MPSAAGWTTPRPAEFPAPPRPPWRPPNTVFPSELADISQVNAAFRVSSIPLGQAILFATAIGILGGLFPAIRAARLPIAAGLRES